MAVNEKNFYGAKMNCRTDGGYLASPINSNQLDKVMDLASILLGSVYKIWIVFHALMTFVQTDWNGMMALPSSGMTIWVLSLM